MESIIPRTNGELSTEIGETTVTSWKPPANLTYEKWEQIGNTLQTINGSLNWWIGDWLNVGEERYGDTYVQAINATDASVESLKKYKAVSSRIPFSIRKESLSWSHHLNVAYLPEDERSVLLMIANKYGLSSRELKELAIKDAEDRRSVIDSFLANEHTPHATYDDLLSVLEVEPQYELSEPIEVVSVSEENPQIEDPDGGDLPFSDFPEEDALFGDEEVLEDDEEVTRAFEDLFAARRGILSDTEL